MSFILIKNKKNKKLLVSQSLAPLLSPEVASPVLRLILLPRLPLLKVFLRTVVASNADVVHATEGTGIAHDLIAICYL